MKNKKTPKKIYGFGTLMLPAGMERPEIGCWEDVKAFLRTLVLQPGEEIGLGVGSDELAMLNNNALIALRMRGMFN
jgi:hypothetical protein